MNRSKLNLTFSALALCLSLNFYAQLNFNSNLSTYSQASPDVAGATESDFYNANHYTGKVNVSLPIYTVKSGDIEYPLFLSYNMGGIRVDQLASEVGLGWNLSRAMITRTINQDNDFDNSGNLSLQSDYNTYSNDDKTNDSALRQENLVNKIGYFLQKQTNEVINHARNVDFLPDMYRFQSNSGFSTDFFFSDINTPVETNPSGTKIQATASKIRIDTKKGNFNSSNVWEPVYNLLTHDFFSIVVTTNNGIKYTFSDCDYALNQQMSSIGYSYKDSPAQVSAWHITKIEDLKTGKTINFEYDITSSNPNHLTSSAPAFNSLVAQRSYSYSTSVTNNSTETSTYNQDIEDFVARVDIQKKRLKKIIFDEGEIIFNYNNAGVSGQSAFTRNDVFNSDCLTQVYVKDKNQKLIKTFNFSYGYFTSDYNVGEFNPDGVSNTYRYNRLKLLKFEEIGKPAYKFSYEESAKLPPVNSFSIDFLGYYNNSSDKATLGAFGLSNSFPTLYYYQNQFEKSLLPYPIPGMSGVTISGYFNRQANDYAKTWSLNKIEYPTGGFMQFVYEAGKFEEFGQNITGAGVRVAQQIINEGSGGTTRTINYSYTKTNGQTSGKLSSTPYFGFPKYGNLYGELSFPANEQPVTISGTGTNNSISWQIYDKNNLTQDAATNAFVGYARVIESETGRGRKEYSFTSSSLPGYENHLYRFTSEYLATQYTQPFFSELVYTGRIDEETGIPEYRSYGKYNHAISNSAVFSNIFTDNSYKRGRLIEEKIFSETNQLLQQTSFSYNENLINTYKYYQGYIHLTSEPIGHPVKIIFPRSNPVYVTDYRNFVREYSEAFMILKKEIKVSQFLPTAKTVISFDNAGNQNSETTNLAYNPYGILKSLQTTIANGDTKKTEYHYLNDITSTSSLPGDVLTTGDYNMYVNYRNNTNNLSNPIQQSSYTNGTITSAMRKTFKIYDSTNLVLPEYLKVSKGTNNLFVKNRITAYELLTSNPVEIQEDENLKTAYVWGYNKTKIIAKIENFSYATLSATAVNTLQTASNQDNDNCRTAGCKEQALRAALVNLRTSLATNHPAAMLTTYTYDPLVGITSITDPSGITQYYTYDTQQRLIKVEDADGKILTETEYHFKPQTP